MELITMFPVKMSLNVEWSDSPFILDFKETGQFEKLKSLIKMDYSNFKPDYNLSRDFYNNIVPKYGKFGLFWDNVKLVSQKLHVNFSMEKDLEELKTFDFGGILIAINIKDGSPVAASIYSFGGNLVKAIRNSIFETKLFFGLPVLSITTLDSDINIWIDNPTDFRVVFIQNKKYMLNKEEQKYFLQGLWQVLAARPNQEDIDFVEKITANWECLNSVAAKDSVSPQGEPIEKGDTLVNYSNGSRVQGKGYRIQNPLSMFLEPNAGGDFTGVHKYFRFTGKKK